jgi:hypothetical protein
MTQLHMERSHLEVGINAVANAFAGTVTSDVINMKNFQRVRFLVHWGVGATGTTLLTLEACDDVTPSNTTAIPFKYRRIVGAGVPSAISAATTAGFTTTAGSNQVYELEATQGDMASTGYGFIRLKAVEQVASALLGGVLIELLDAKYAGPTHESEVD